MKFAAKAVLAVFAVLSLVAIAAVLFTQPAGGNAHDQAGPVVRVMVGNGHGTGVHIGDGYILTAEHVIDESADAPKNKPVPITIRDDRGNDTQAELLWSTKGYDVALLRIANPSLAAAPLSCRALAVGETITTTGHPLSLEFVTYSGRVAGTARKLGDWGSVVPVDVLTGSGMSGGPYFDASGQVVAIHVGVHRNKTSAFPLAVPAPVLCELLAR